jgi:hypothetical protein
LSDTEAVTFGNSLTKISNVSLVTHSSIPATADTVNKCTPAVAGINSTPSVKPPSQVKTPVPLASAVKPSPRQSS